MQNEDTKLIYLTDSYKTSLVAKVIDVVKTNGEKAIVLDKTIFYPLGGGQPSDQGKISGSFGMAEIYNCLYKEGKVYHYTKTENLPAIGEKVELNIDWTRRYKNMLIHSAGHIVDFAMNLIGLTPKPLLPVKGDHGKKAYILYQGTTDFRFLELLQKKIDELIEKNLEFKTEFKTREEIEKTSIYVQSGLPSNKPLRVLILDKVGEVPDGGTQVKTTGEVEKIIIENIEEVEGNTFVYYKVEKKITLVKNEKKVETDKMESSKFKKELDEAKSLIERILNQKEFEVVKLKYLGSSGLINRLTKTLKEASSNEKKALGIEINALKSRIIEDLEKKEIELNSKNKIEDIDYSIPKNFYTLGSLNPITHTIFQIEEILGKLGFVRKRYREVENNYYPFEALNIPKDHPAQDETETFYVENGKFVLTPHTSSGQVREMEQKKPPIKMLNISKCYRKQESVKHSPMFHQFEGLYIDKGVSIGHLKGTLDYFAKSFFGEKRVTRIRPYNFRFTEPSFEVDVSCNKCNGKGCKVCKEGWLEIGGAGMVHPKVLKNGGIDSTIYSGFAFGWGVERITMMQGDINIPDIRILYGINLDFLKNF